MNATGPTEFLLDLPMVAFDTETTGIWAPAHRVVEIGAIKFTLRNGVQDRFQQLVNPERAMPEVVIGIHGITDEMVADAPTIEPVMRHFLDFCGPHTALVAHNTVFDLAFLACEMDRIGLTPPENPMLDTIDIHRRLNPRLGSYALLSLSRHFDLAQSQDHRALADAELVRQLVVKAADSFPPIHSIDDLNGHFTVYRFRDWQQESIELPSQYSDLSEALKYHRRVRLCYHKPGHEPGWRVVVPRHVYTADGKIYLAAHCELVGSGRTFRLDRISEYEVLSDDAS